MDYSQRIARELLKESRPGEDRPLVDLLAEAVRRGYNLGFSIRNETSSQAGLQSWIGVRL